MLIACACISKEICGGTGAPVYPGDSNCRQVRAHVHVQTSPHRGSKTDMGALRYPKYRAPFCAPQSVLQGFIKAYPKIKFLLRLTASATHR